MLYMLLIYGDPSEAPPEAQSQEHMQRWFTYTEDLQKAGVMKAGDALEMPDTATTVRVRDGETLLTDGPFAETKEMLGGILVLEAKDKAEAVAIISRHPGIRIGPFEVRPANEAFMAQHPVLRKQ
jgi:hypothetical protein